MLHPKSLRLVGQLQVHTDAHAAYDAAAHRLMEAAIAAVEQRHVYHLALSGGSTPQPLYTLLVTDPRFRAIPWEQTHVWIVDERQVPHDDARSNFKMIRETLLDHVPILDRHVHPMLAVSSDPAGQYEQALLTAFQLPEVGLRALPRLDFVLLGMGDDTHTASLFPGSPAIHETSRWIAVNQGDTVTPPPLVTMTFPLLNAARELLVLVLGEGKAAALGQVDQQLQTAGPDPLNMPITGIQPDSGELLWCIDAKAAGVDDDLRIPLED